MIAGPLTIEVRRGRMVEARHVVDVSSTSDSHSLGAAVQTLLRSVAKPFQAVRVVAAAPDLSSEQLAILSSSHDGRPEARRLTAEVLRLAGLDERALRCTADRSRRLGHPCSGTHAGMLLLASALEADHEEYISVSHPVQRVLATETLGWLRVSEATVPPAGDGCGVPTYPGTLPQLAAAFGRLAAADSGPAHRVAQAMRDHRDLIGAPDSPDVLLMGVLEGAIAKHGQEGLLCIGLPDGTGIAAKARDGSNRALLPAVAQWLGIADFEALPINDDLDQHVGVIEAQSANGNCCDDP